MTLKAIETRYKGYRFRSRLEARWAVFFDELGFRWEYEREGYVLANGEWYLPDFYLDSEWEFIEVKAETVDSAEEIAAIEKRCELLSRDSGRQVILVHGDPYHCITTHTWVGFDWNKGHGYGHCSDFLKHIRDGSHAAIEAAIAARGARFEHGERG